MTLREGVLDLFGCVGDAVERATRALLEDDPELADTVVAADREVDERAAELDGQAWRIIDHDEPDPVAVRELAVFLLILPELERSADLAEHIAQRAANGLGTSLSPVSRGVVARMGEVAVEMWRTAAGAFADGGVQGEELDEADEELDILYGRLTGEVASGRMDAGVAAQVTLLARFYERLGDHAVNLARRCERFPPPVG